MTTGRDELRDERDAQQSLIIINNYYFNTIKIIRLINKGRRILLGLGLGLGTLKELL
jgi:hypothetical protein